MKARANRIPVALSAHCCPGSAWSERAFPLVESLPLYENQLMSLATGTFTRLSNLAGLYLNDNNISVLHQGCFDGLQGRFQYLAFSNNQLTPQACNANFAAIARIPSACFSNSTT